MLTRFSGFLLALAVVFLPVSGMGHARTGEDGRRIVRVAYYTVADYQERDASGKPRGYNNEYLQKIAQVANWELKYVFTSLGGALDMLARGEVDIAGFLDKTPEREGVFDYPDFYSGIVSSVVVTLKDAPDIKVQDATSLRNRTIGVVRRNETSRRFLELMRRMDIPLNIVTFETEEEQVAALEARTVEAIVQSRLHGGGTLRIVFDAGHTPFYFATTKGNKKVLHELNDALGEIQSRHPAFEAKLADSYFPAWGQGDMLFSEKEKDFIQQSPPIKVTYDPNWYPIEFHDKKTGTMGGVGREVLDLIAERSGLRFEFITHSSPRDAIKAFLDGACDIITGYSSNAAFVDGHAATEPYLSMPVAYIGNKNFIFSAKTDNISIALPEYFSGTPLIISRERPNYKIIFYPTVEACVQAVLKGEVTLTAENIHVAQHSILKKYPELAIIDTTNLNFTTQFIFTRGTSPLLVSILDKCVASIPLRDVENLFFKYAAMTYRQVGLSRLEKNIIVGLGGTCVAILVLSFFVWQLSRKNTEVRAALAHAEEANRTKTEFFKNLSHELRTPINAIMGLTQTAMATIGDKDMVLAKLKKTYASSEHLLGLINNILDLSKIEAGRGSLVLSCENTREEFDFLCDMFATRCALKEITLHHRWDENIAPHLLMDKTKVDQVLINILGNAIKFTPKCGHVYFVAEQLECLGGRELLRFTIRDTGPGIDAETLRKIFVPFERSTTAIAQGVEGAGLGMPIAKKLTELMGGDLEVESQPGAGTTVALTLWCDLCKPVPQADQDEEEECWDDLAGKRVLLVEDVPINQEIASEMLRSVGVEVDVADNGKEGYERFLAMPPGYYTLVFMDLMMPVMDGYAATAAIRSSSRPDAATIPIIALTANAFAEDVANAKKSGMNSHLAKPFKMEELYEMLRHHIAPA